jgi:O-antigen ligase
VALRRAVRWAVDAGICLAVLLGMLLLACAAAAWVTFAAGGGVAPLLGGIGLCAVAVGYLGLCVGLIGQKRRSDGSGWL